MRAALLALTLAPSLVQAGELEDARSALLSTDRRLQRALLGGGAVSVAVGAGLLATPVRDHALQVAGGVTLAFGVVDLAAGIAGELAIRREARTLGHDRRALLETGAHRGLVFGVNLGLDVGFALAGLAAVTASQLGADHPDRWLAGGLAAASQGAFAMVIDAIGTAAARRAHRTAERAPLQAEPPGGGASGHSSVSRAAPSH